MFERLKMLFKKTPKYDLERFKEAQEADFEFALEEIRAGKKYGHWIWHVFPQLRGLGKSDRSYVFGIVSLDEAKAYLKDKQLRANLLTITQALQALPTEDITDVVDFPDNLKIWSSMTLFYHASEDDIRSVFGAVIDKYYDGKFDKRTEEMLFGK